MALKYTRLSGSDANFQQMIQRFGVVTVMNAKVYEPFESEEIKDLQADAIIKKYLGEGTKLCDLDTLKIANVSEEGPTKTVTGGQYNNPLIKFGKTARLEMQDALGSAAALDALCGAVAETESTLNVTSLDYDTTYAVHFGSNFSGPKCIIGDSFFIDQKSGQQVPVNIIFYQFLPDSLFNLTQDAEGDATVFDMNGDLLSTDITVSTINGGTTSYGVFYSIVDAELSKASATVTWSFVKGSGDSYKLEVNAPEGLNIAISYDGEQVTNTSDFRRPQATDGTDLATGRLIIVDTDTNKILVNVLTPYFHILGE